MIVNHEIIRRMFKYDKESGDVIHLNGTRSGKIAGMDLGGYRTINIDGRGYAYWRIIAYIIQDKIPKSVKYIDGNKQNTARNNLKFVY